MTRIKATATKGRVGCSTPRVGWGLISLALGLTMAVGWGCSSKGADLHRSGTRGPAIIELRLPETPLRRPAVQFDHQAHAQALQKEGCESCHQVDQTRVKEGAPAGYKPLVFQVLSDLDPADRDGSMDAYHELCLDCHNDRIAAGKKSGAVACGECHVEGDVEREANLSLREPLRFDSSLHYRHVKAYDDKCESCHHVAGEGPGQRAYKKGAEESCRGCHGAVEQEGRPSLQHAVHQDCVGCHQERQAQANQAAGPVTCLGCHDGSAQQAFIKIDKPPRLLVEHQPDAIWLQAPGATSNLVPFDHQAHELHVESCSTCHHERLTKCSECHTVKGSAEGDWVTLEEAYHRVGTQHSCVGCHQQKAGAKDCAGCHDSLPAPPSEGACLRCHSGPSPTTEPLPAYALSPVLLAPLPPVSEDFPETVLIDGLASEYGPSSFPHKKIVEHLAGLVGKSKLAARFHGTTDTLCAGCHHESPPGTRPPSCGSCHDKRGDPTRDKPGLQAAYHRQCLGCHQQMAIEPQGCTKGCHEKAKEEGKP